MEKLINDFKICFTKGDTYALAVKFKDISSDLSEAYFTVKENPDDEPLFVKRLDAGISKIDDRAYKLEKTYKVQIQANDTAFLEAGVQYLYDLQVSIGNVVKTVLSGVFVVNHSVSGVTSATTSALEVTAVDEVETEFATTPATVGLEYESDPVALAKIGNLANLPTSSRSTVAGALTEVWMTSNQNRLELSAIKTGNLAVEEANNAYHATNADYANTAGSAGTAMSATVAGNASFASQAYGLALTPINSEDGKTINVSSSGNGLYAVVYRYVAGYNSQLLPELVHVYAYNVDFVYVLSDAWSFGARDFNKVGDDGETDLVATIYSSGYEINKNDNVELVCAYKLASI